MAGSTVPSLKVVKQFTYKGANVQWSNRYHFSGGTPSGTTPWTTLSDAVVTAEKAILLDSGNAVTIVQTVGYEAGSEVPVFTKTYSTVGTFAKSTAPVAPGDAAVCIRYSTNARTAKNHPKYLFNYYHGICLNSTSNGDTQYTSQKNYMDTYAASWITGFSDGTHTLVRCGPQGDLATGRLVLPYITHRDFPSG